MNAITNISLRGQSSEMVATSLGDLNVVQTGLGRETILLWPSIFTDHQIYDYVVNELAQEFTFILIDGPAHGQSEGPDKEFTMKDCADALAEVMDHFGVDQAVVGGTSWGGLVAAELALTQPKRVSAVILMNTPMEIDGKRPKLSARFISFGARWMLWTATFRNGVAKSFFSDAALREHPDYETRFHQMLSSAKPAALTATVRSVILRGAPLMDRMKNIGHPVCVIAGKDDAMYPVETQAEAALFAPKGQFHPVNGNHISAIEAPAKVASIIKHFVQQEGLQ